MFLKILRLETFPANILNFTLTRFEGDVNRHYLKREQHNFDFSFDINGLPYA